MSQTQYSPIMEEMRTVCTRFAADTNAQDFRFLPASGPDDAVVTEGAARFLFDSFEAVFFYDMRAGKVKQVLECRIAFPLGKLPVDFSLYDLLYLLDENDFHCYIFPNIHSPEQMRACLGVLRGAIERYREQLSAIGNNPQLIEHAQRRRRKEMLRFFKQDIFSGSMDHPVFGWRMRTYREWYLSRFCSSWYAAYLAGDYRKAAKKFAAYDNKSDYELRLFRFIKTLEAGASYTAVGGETNTYLQTGAVPRPALLPAQVAAFLLAAIPCAVLFALFSLMICLCVYRDALYTTALFGSRMIFGILFCAALTGAVIARRFYRRLLPASLRERLEREQAAVGRSARPRTARLHLTVITCLIVLALSAKSGMALYDKGLVDNRTLFSQTTELYSNVTELYYVTDADAYYLRFSDGALFSCNSYVAQTYVLPYVEREIQTVEHVQEIDGNL